MLGSLHDIALQDGAWPARQHFQRSIGHAARDNEGAVIHAHTHARTHTHTHTHTHTNTHTHTHITHTHTHTHTLHTHTHTQRLGAECGTSLLRHVASQHLWDSSAIETRTVRSRVYTCECKRVRRANRFELNCHFQACSANEECLAWKFICTWSYYLRSEIETLVLVRESA